MTFTILALDGDSGAIGGASATGNLCVGGWVLRGDARGGITASQGMTPSTLWGEDALAALCRGVPAAEAVEATQAGDAGRAQRQLAALDLGGGTGIWDGPANHPYTGHLRDTGWIVAGNWLAGPQVLEAAAARLAGDGDFETRLIEALAAGIAAGSDSRGTLSAALLTVAEDRPPLSLRIDHDEDPLGRLRLLHARTREAGYAGWLATLPTRSDPERMA